MRVDRIDEDLDDDVGEVADAVNADADGALDNRADGELEDVTGERLDDDPQVRAEAWTAYRDKVDDIYRAYAIDQGCERVREIEEKVITPALQRIEAEDPSRHLVGLDHCLKGKERLTEKVAEAMTERARTPAEAFATVKDAIRYTFQYAEDRYSDGVLRDCERLNSAGFEPVDLKNTWSAEQYKGINSRWRVSDSGQMFEVQFHTASSFEAKQSTHVAYERLRSPGTSKAEQDELATYQREVTSKVPIPPGAADIPEYR